MEGIIQRIAASSSPVAKLIRLKSPASLSEYNEQVLKQEKEKELLNRMEETKKRLNAMRSAFECEKDFNVIEAYIYEINALEIQYSHLFKLAKQAHIKGTIQI